MPAPTLMRAAVIDRFGSPEVFRVERLPVPVPEVGEVLVRVWMVGLNAIDWKTRAGNGVGVGEFPAVLGWDVVGEVVSTGPETTRWRPGDEVFGMLRFPALAGAYAGYVAAPESELAMRPATVDYRGAAGAMVSLTAWQTLFERGELVSGQRVLVHGAAGGVGHVAVQLARAADAEVTATASARNQDFLTKLGASQVIDYRSHRVEKEANDFDLVVDTRGGDDFFRLLDVVRPGGTIVTLTGRQPGQEEQAKSTRPTCRVHLCCA